MEKVRDCWPVKSEASEEAHALSSTQERKDEMELGKIIVIFVHTKKAVELWSVDLWSVDLNHQITTSCPLDVVFCTPPL